MLDQKTQQFLDNIIKGASNEELFAASRMPANVEVQDQTVVEGEARVKPIEFETGYKFKSDQTKPYVENVNRAIESRLDDKAAFAANAQDAFKRRQEQEINLKNIVNQAQQAKTPYQRPEDLKIALSKAQQDASTLEKMPEQDLATQAILSFAPALFGAIGGESAAISQVKGGQQARELVAAQRKEQSESIKSRNEQIMKKYEQLVKIDSGLADDWLAKQKLDTEQARLGADILKFGAGLSDKDLSRSEQLAAQASRDALQGTLKGAGEAVDVESEPAKEAARNKRASIVAKGLGLKEATSLRKEFLDRPQVKDFADIAAGYEKVQVAKSDPSPAGDISLIFGYMKMLDPGSVVREGEFATAQNAAGVPDRILNAYNSALNGTRLNPKQRKDFLNQARNVYNAQQGLVKSIEADYSDLLAPKYGTTGDLVVPRKSTPKAPEPEFDPKKDLPKMTYEQKLKKAKEMGLIK